jgi:hypothetical protein
MRIGFAFSFQDSNSLSETFVIPDFTSFPPEIINFLPYILNKSGIRPDTIKEVTLGESSKDALVITTAFGNKISLEIKLSQKS